MYSGGTDSTCVAALIAEEFDRLHLITFKRFGIFSVNNAALNVTRLKDKFGQDRFVHVFLNIDKLFREISYTKYWHNIKNYGFFLLSTCGLCKLTMHVRSLVYCLENKIKFVYDGANKDMMYFPAQMQGVIDEIRKMYAQYGIIYAAPVYEFDKSGNIGWFDKLSLESQQLLNFKKEYPEKKNTTGRILFKMGIFAAENIKGAKIDHKMQPRCFQLILFNIFVQGYFIPVYGLQRYKEVCVDFYKERIEYLKKFIKEYLEKKKGSKLCKLLEYNFTK